MSGSCMQELGDAELMSREATRIKALQMLIFANAFWGLSFPATKALAMSQQDSLGLSSWFVAALCGAYRFALAALVLLLGSARTLPPLPPPHPQKGGGLGFLPGAGPLLRAGGVGYTGGAAVRFR